MPVAAQTGDAGASDTITWSVRPSPTSDEPSRDVFRFEVNPGDAINDVVHVQLATPTQANFDVYVADAKLSDTGVFDLEPRNTKSSDSASWATVATPQIQVAPNMTVGVPFTLRVPANATPGDHTAGIVASLATPTPAAGGTVLVDRRIGARIYLRVRGAVRSQLTVSELAANWDGGIPSGRVTTTFLVRNTGNVRVHALALTHLSGRLGESDADPKPLPELLPGSSLRVTTRGEVMASGRVNVLVRLIDRPSHKGEEPALTFPGTQVATHTSAPPWLVVVAVLVALGVALGAVVVRRRSRRG